MVALASAIVHLVLKTRHFQDKNDSGVSEALKDTLSDGPTAANFVIILVALLGFAFTGGLTGFHIYLMWNNVTTAESFKKSFRNASCEADDLRGLRAVAHILSQKRPPSRITSGYTGPRYLDETFILNLIAQQDEDDRVAQISGSGPRPPLVGDRVPPASARVAKLTANHLDKVTDNIV